VSPLDVAVVTNVAACCRARRQAVDNPIPRPRPAERPEKNGSNRCSRTAACGLWPLSSTTSSTFCLPSVWARMAACPLAGAASMAFRKRLLSAARACAESASIRSSPAGSAHTSSTVRSRAKGVSNCVTSCINSLTEIVCSLDALGRANCIRSVRIAWIRCVCPMTFCSDGPIFKRRVLQIFSDVHDLIGRHVEPVELLDHVLCLAGDDGERIIDFMPRRPLRTRPARTASWLAGALRHWRFAEVGRRAGDPYLAGPARSSQPRFDGDAPERYEAGPQATAASRGASHDNAGTAKRRVSSAIASTSDTFICNAAARSASATPTGSIRPGSRCCCNKTAVCTT